MKQKKNIKGFTLTEMIVVIAIIGILAAVLIPSVVIYVQRAQKSNDEQLAASMTDEIERYCIENDIEQEDLLGTDIRTILNFKGIDTTPKRNKWTFVYDIETKVVSVVELSAIQVDGSHKFVDPTNYREGYYLLGKGESELEQVVSALCRVISLPAYNTADELAKDPSIQALVDYFDPEDTLYISNSLVFAKQNVKEFNQVVFTENTVHIPTLRNSNLIQENINDIDIDTSNMSAVLKTIRKNSELQSIFSNLKVMDESNLIDISDQFEQDITTDANGKVTGVGTPIFTLGDNFEIALFAEINLVQTETYKGVAVYSYEVCYYNENGLFAYCLIPFSN